MPDRNAKWFFAPKTWLGLSALGLALQLIGAPPALGQESNICTFAKAVLAEAPTDFAKFKGAKSSDGLPQDFAGTYVPSGASDCTLTERRTDSSGEPQGAEYGCKLAIGMDLAAGQSKWQAAANEVRQCSETKSWSYTESKPNPNVWTLRGVDSRSGRLVHLQMVVIPAVRVSHISLAFVNRP